MWTEPPGTVSSPAHTWRLAPGAGVTPCKAERRQQGLTVIERLDARKVVSAVPPRGRIQASILRGGPPLRRTARRGCDRRAGVK